MAWCRLLAQYLVVSLFCFDNVENHGKSDHLDDQLWYFVLWEHLGPDSQSIVRNIPKAIVCQPLNNSLGILYSHATPKSAL
jgi:hypothetical protein